jgi:amino acid transporter
MSENKTELRRVLGLPSLVAQGLAYLCPACITLYFGIEMQMTNGQFPIAMIIASCAMVLTAMSYAKMSRKYPVAGSVYSYVGKSMHPTMGFIAGWIIMLDYFLLPMACYLSCGLYLNIMFPAIPIWCWIVISVIFCCACNYFGVRISSVVNSINVILPILAVIVTIVLIAIFVSGGGGTGTFFYGKAIYDPSLFSWAAVIPAAGILAIVFVGFDSVTTFSEETINPEKTMGRAVLIICIGAGIEFSILAYIMVLGWPDAVGQMVDPNTAITEYYVHIGAAWMNPLFIGLNTLACLGCIIAGQAATARILMGMGRDGFIPKKFFGFIHPRWQTPSRNILLVSAIGLTAIIFQNSLANALSLVSFGALAGFVFTNLTVVAQYYIRDKQRNFKGIIFYLVIPVIAAVVCGYLWISLAPSAKIVGFSWMALGIVFAVVKTKGFRNLPPEISFE